MMAVCAVSRPIAFRVTFRSRPRARPGRPPHPAPRLHPTIPARTEYWRTTAWSPPSNPTGRSSERPGSSSSRPNSVRERSVAAHSADGWPLLAGPKEQDAKVASQKARRSKSLSAELARRRSPLMFEVRSRHSHTDKTHPRAWDMMPLTGPIALRCHGSGAPHRWRIAPFSPTTKMLSRELPQTARPGTAGW
jgi:hypothetical protein